MRANERKEQLTTRTEKRQTFLEPPEKIIKYVVCFAI